MTATQGFVSSGVSKARTRSIVFFLVIAFFGFSEAIASASPSISYSPNKSSYLVGETVSEYGNGFTPNRTYTMYFYQNGVLTGTPGGTVASNGTWSRSWRFDSTQPGNWTWQAKDDWSGAWSNLVTYSVGQVSVSASPSTVAKGGIVRASWSGYGANVNVKIVKGGLFWATAAQNVSGTGYQDFNTGGSSPTWETRADYRVQIELADGTSQIFSNYFAVTQPVSPSISYSPSKATYSVGENVTEYGSGFTPNGSYTMYFYQNGAFKGSPTGTIASNGTWTSSWRFDSTQPGNWTWQVRDDSSGVWSNTVTYSVAPVSVSVSPASVVKGGIIRASWSGYGANVNVKIVKGGLFWTTAAQNVPGTGYQDFNTGGSSPTWETRTDYRVQIELTDGTSLIFSDYFAVTAAINPTVSNSPSKSTYLVGETITQSGSGFTPNGTCTLQFFHDGVKTTPDGTLTADASGYWSQTYRFNSGNVGSWTWKAIDNSSGAISNTVSHSVAPVSVSVSPTSVVKGGTIRASWSGYGANVNVKIVKGGLFWTTAAQNLPGTGTLDLDTGLGSPDWELRTDYRVQMELTDGTSLAFSDYFSVTALINPSISYSPTRPSYSVGETVAENGNGFTPNNTYTMYFYQNGVLKGTPTDTVAANGTWTRPWTFDSTQTGDWTWKARDNASGLMSNTVSYSVCQAVNPTVFNSPAKSSYSVGDTVVNSGSGFTPNGSCTLRFTHDGVDKGGPTLTADWRGSVGSSYTFPSNAVGNWTFQATDTATGRASNTVSYSVVPAVVSASFTVSPGDQQALSFGPAPLGGPPVERTFVISNVGTERVTGGVSVASPFTIAAGGIYDIATGGSATVTVRFTPPVTAGNYDRVVTFDGAGITMVRHVSGSTATATMAAGTIMGTVTVGEGGASPVAGQGKFAPGVPLTGAQVSTFRIVNGVPQPQGQVTYTRSAGDFSVSVEPGLYTTVMTLPGTPAGNTLLERAEVRDILVPSNGIAWANVMLNRLPYDPNNPKEIPVVLVSGQDEDRDWDSKVWPWDKTGSDYWQAMRGYLAGEGFHNVWDCNDDSDTTVVNPHTGRAGHFINGELGIEKNAETLQSFIRQKVARYGEQHPGQPPLAQINIVAHSMGGLTTRRLLTKLQTQSTNVPRVGKVVMLSTPNAGSVLADDPDDTYSRLSVALAQTLDAIPNVGGTPGFSSGVATLLLASSTKSLHWESTRDLRTGNFVNGQCGNFSALNPWPSNSDTLLYLTGGEYAANLFVCGPSTDNLGLFFLGSVMQDLRPAETANDGMVSIWSAQGYYFRPTSWSQRTWVREKCFQYASPAIPFRGDWGTNHAQVKTDSRVLTWVGGILTSPGPVSSAIPLLMSAPLKAEVAPTTVTRVEVDMLSGVLERSGHREVAVPCDALSSFTLLLSYDTKAVSFSLRNPAGAAILPSGFHPVPGVQYVALDTTATAGGIACYTVSAPTTGTWIAILDTPSTASATVPWTLRVYGYGALDVAPTGGSLFHPAEEVLLSCFVGTWAGDALTSVTGAVAEAFLTGPTGGLTTCTLADDGAHWDGRLLDGQYAGMAQNMTLAGDYEVLYRVDGTDPVSGAPFRRVKRAALSISSGAGFIAGNLSHRSFDIDGDGRAEHIGLECQVSVAGATTGTLTCDLVDASGTVRISAAQEFVRTAPGTTAVTLLFDNGAIGVPGVFGPWKVENLQFFEQRGGRAYWMDTWPGDYSVGVSLAGPGTYGGLQVTLAPPAAVAAGAQWRIVDDPTTTTDPCWRGSGAAVIGLLPGDYGIAFSPVAGWITPSNQGLPIWAAETTTVTATYTLMAPGTGALLVMLFPTAAVTGGAQWRRVGTGPWLTSGATEAGISPGSCTVEFSPAVGWVAPGNREVQIVALQTALTTGTYVQMATGAGALRVALAPPQAVTAGAKWRRVGTAPWLAGGDTESGLSTGTCRVEFKPVGGWIAPTTQTLTLAAGETRETTGTYAMVATQYTVTFQTDGTPGASLTGATSQTVNYSADCTAVTANAPVGWHFVRWSDGVQTAARTDRNVTADLTLTATFAINRYHLAYAAGANGSIDGATSQTVNHGANGTTVTAVPTVGYHFTQWSDGILTAARTETNVTGGLSVTANFAVNRYTVAFQTDGAVGSTLTGTASQTVDHGTDCTAVTANAPVGWHFARWTKAGAFYSFSNPLTVRNVTEDMTLTATFAPGPPPAATLTVF